MDHLKHLQTRVICLRRTLHMACEELSEMLYEIQLLQREAYRETPPEEGETTPI